MKILPFNNRFKELFCVLFGHDFREYGSTTDRETGIVIEEYNTCCHCGLENHDRSGCSVAFAIKYGIPND